MDSSDISIISKKMESMAITQHVVRHSKKLPQSRYSPYTKETKFTIEKQKEEFVRLGVEYSLVVAEAMFILSDDIRSMLFFCPLILSYAGYKDFNGPVVGRVFCGILHVFETYFKPKNGVYKDASKSIQWGLIGKALHNFSFGIKDLDRMVSILGKSESSLGGGLKPSDFEHYSQELKKLEKKLRSFKDVNSEMNGFPREAIKSHILHLWKSLFETSPPPNLVNPMIRFLDMFMPLLNQAREDVCSRLLTSLHI